MVSLAAAAIINSLPEATPNQVMIIENLNAAILSPLVVTLNPPEATATPAIDSQFKAIQDPVQVLMDIKVAAATLSQAALTHNLADPTTNQVDLTINQADPTVNPATVTDHPAALMVNNLIVVTAADLLTVHHHTADGEKNSPCATHKTSMTFQNRMTSNSIILDKKKEKFGYTTLCNIGHKLQVLLYKYLLQNSSTFY